MSGKKNPWQQSWGKGTTVLPGRLAALISGEKSGTPKKLRISEGTGGSGVPIRSYQ